MSSTALGVPGRSTTGRDSAPRSPRECHPTHPRHNPHDQHARLTAPPGVDEPAVAGEDRGIVRPEEDGDTHPRNRSNAVSSFVLIVSFLVLNLISYNLFTDFLVFNNV